MSAAAATARRGLSLLEVMLALAILGVSLAAIGELMRIGARNAEMGRDLTTAQILCEDRMAQIVAGLLPSTTTPASPIEEAGSGEDWLYEIQSQPVPGQEGLLSVQVTVQQNPDLYPRPAFCSLVRWIVDPTWAATSTDQSSTGTGG